MVSVPNATLFAAMVSAVSPSASKVAVTSPLNVSPDKIRVPVRFGRVMVWSEVGSAMAMVVSLASAVDPSNTRGDPPKIVAVMVRESVAASPMVVSAFNAVVPLKVMVPLSLNAANGVPLSLMVKSPVELRLIAKLLLSTSPLVMVVAASSERVSDISVKLSESAITLRVSVSVAETVALTVEESLTVRVLLESMSSLVVPSVIVHPP